jgi:iron complex outermembrane recepter protein
MKLSSKLLLGVSCLAISVTGATPAAVAQDDALEEVIVVGSRRAARSGADTPVPVDVLSASDFANQGDSDMANLLRNIIPSYNVNAQPISDAATLIRPANLRGLPPDSTLVLVNGKRRHRAAVISFLGGGLSDGAQGPDISTIPAIALKRVEVLRDGAAAQYGSDAIAGVINFVLDDATEGLRFEAKYGQTIEGDGDAYQISGAAGMPLGQNGFLDFSFEWREADPTSRSVQRTDALGLIAGGNTDVRTPAAQVWGTPEIRNDWKVFFNSAVEAGENQEFYAFGNYAERTAEGGFFFRNPNTRGGVFSGDGGTTRLVGDLTPGDGVTCTGGIDFATGNIPNPLTIGSAGEAAALAAITADPNCFVFNEKFPGGFTPSFGGNLNDIAGVMGLRGELDNGLTYDLSAAAGRNQADFFISNTVNASLGPATPTTFRLGSYTQLEKNLNLDMSYPVAIEGLASDLNIAFGGEWREEQFTATTGQPESFQIGVLAQPVNVPGVGDVVQGFGIGSNGFSGFNPSVAGVFDRTNVAAYIDLEADLTDRLIVAAALRYEDFSDFGTTTNGKISALYRITDTFSFRGSFNTGFRAPTPGQQNVVNVSTVFEADATGALQLVQRGTIPPGSPVAGEVGGKPLSPEKSTSFTYGAAMNFDRLTLTVDFFSIKLNDRITQSTSFSLTDAQKTKLLAAGVSDAADLSTFRFFINDFDTKTIGVDVVATMPLDITDTGATTLALVGNWTKTTVERFNPTLLSATRIRQLEENLPRTRGNVSLTHVEDSWRGLVRANYYGSYFEAHLDSGDLPIDAGAEITFDAELGVTIIEGIEISVGGQNIFNNFPDLNPFAGIVGAKYPVTSPMGINGGFYYARLRLDF